FRDRIGQNHVERRDPIGRDKEQRFAEIEDFTDLPAPQFFYSRKIDNRLRVGLHLPFFAMAGLIVKPRARILHGHDWVFSSEVLKIFGKPEDGDVISLKDGRDKMLIIGAIVDLFGGVTIIERNDSPVRKAEGLELITGVLKGAAPSGPIKIEIGGLKFDVDLLHAQKTGFYLDQAPNYSTVAQFVQ